MPPSGVKCYSKRFSRLVKYAFPIDHHRLAKTRSHIIYCDSQLNTEHVVHLNIYQNFLLSAMKMHSYIREWGSGANLASSFLYGEWPFTHLTVREAYLHAIDTVRQMILYCYAVIRSKRSSRIAKLNHGSISVSKSNVIWWVECIWLHVRQYLMLKNIRLGTYAFHSVLSRKPQPYGSLLRSLALDLERLKHRQCSRRFRKLVKEGMAGLVEIAFWERSPRDGR